MNKINLKFHKSPAGYSCVMPEDITGEYVRVSDLESLDVEKLIETLRQEVIQLRLWAIESRRGGWLTHQIEPMNRRAKEIENILESFQS